MAGLKTIIALSFVIAPPLSYTSSIKFVILTVKPFPQILAIGFLLVILSSALFHNYLPLLVVATYVVAPLPNWIAGRCANPDDFIDSSGGGGPGGAAVDIGRFVTGFLVVMGIGKWCDCHLRMEWLVGILPSA